jgi:site-specific recombinase XerD
VTRYRSERFQSRDSASAISIETAIREFLLAHERKGDSESYLRELRSYLIGGAGYFGKQRSWSTLVRWADARTLDSIRNLGKEQLGAYLDHVRTVATKGDYGKVCAILKRLLDFCVAESYIDVVLRIERPKRLRAEIKVFTPEEMIRLRNVVIKENVRDWAIFMLLNDTGLRASELCNLRADDFRWERQEVIIRPQIAKNKSFRIVPLSASLRALQRYRQVRGDDMAACDKFFLAFFTTPVVAGAKRANRRNTGRLIFCNSGLTRNGLFFLVKKWGSLAGVSESRCSPHTFRHYFATQYLRQGGNILSLQRILGHSRLDVTERYLKFAAADVKTEHERFSPARTLLPRRIERKDSTRS